MVGYNSAAYDPNGGESESAELRTFHASSTTGNDAPYPYTASFALSIHRDPSANNSISSWPFTSRTLNTSGCAFAQIRAGR